MKEVKPSRGAVVQKILVVCGGVLFFETAVHLAEVGAFLSRLGEVAAPFLAAGVIAFLLSGPVAFFEKKLPRPAAIAAAYLLAAAAAVLLVYIIAPQLMRSGAQLARSAQKYLGRQSDLARHFTGEWGLPPQVGQALAAGWEQLMSRVSAGVEGRVLPAFAGFFFRLAKGVIDTGTALVVSVLLLYDRKGLFRRGRMAVFALLPLGTARGVSAFASRALCTFSGYLRGMLLDSLLVGCLCFAGMTVLGLEYPVLIAVIIAFTNMLPVFGPFIGSVPSAVILMTVDIWQALLFLVLIVALQQFDGNVMAPRILGNAVGLSPLWVLLAIVVGGGLFGFWGMLAGVPAFAVIYRSAAAGMDALYRRSGHGQAEGQGGPM